MENGRLRPCMTDLGSHIFSLDLYQNIAFSERNYTDRSLRLSAHFPAVKCPLICFFSAKVSVV